MRKQYRNYSNELKNSANYNTVEKTLATIDSFVRENSTEIEYEKYLKRVKSYEDLVSYITSNVTSLEFYYNVIFKKMSNNSLSVKKENKRICRIDSAYNKIKIVTDRENMFYNLDYKTTTRSDFRRYFTILCDTEEFSEIFSQICKNASIA